MAANDYYNDYHRQPRRPDPSPSPYHSDSYNSAPDTAYEPSVVSSKPPTYVSHLPQTEHDRPGASQTSPFETDFDDHVYPMQPSAMSSKNNFANDTRYHGADAGNVSPVAGDDIPLQNQNKKGGPTAGIDPMDSSDHVYDASPQRRKTKGGESGKRGLNFGEMGMFGSNAKRIPFMVYLFTIIQVSVFIGELVKSAQLTGSPIQTQPSVSPMLGPPPQILINMGSRYVPCMRNQHGVQDSDLVINWLCPDSPTADPNASTNKCTLQQLCGFGDSVPNPLYQGENPGLSQSPAPNQWFRFIIPIFMHSGFVHIGFNLLLQLTIGKDIERAIGSIRFFLVYMSAGIFGFVMGGNYASPNQTSTGASGSLFGIIAITLLDLLYSWSERQHPGRELIFILIEIIISFALGLLPGLDNFSHIGGFIVGICVGVSVLHSPNSLRRKIGEDHFGGPTYSGLGAPGVTSVAFPAFYRNPVGFFKGRKALWWGWWLMRAAFLVMVIVVFIVLLNNFYTNTGSCSWCKYLSCVPMDSNEYCRNDSFLTGAPSNTGGNH